MFAGFFLDLKAASIPVSLREYLTFLEALQAGLADTPEEFYRLARLSLVKDEKHFDRFDRVFASFFEGAQAVAGAALLARDLPEEWLRKLMERHFTPEEMEAARAAGSFEKLMEMLAERLAEQENRHQGGSKWIGTNGTSPFGAYGYNPEGVRVGQKESRNRSAVKVWDKREFRNLDDHEELSSRNYRVALRRLRRWAREGAEEELDLEGTIDGTARQGWLDVHTRPERRNAARVLLFLDAGGSMDPFVRRVEELFAAARLEFRNLEVFYFHNCLYEGVWRDNRRRWTEQTPTLELLNTYGSGWRCVFVGDASMSPYEIAAPGGANEHWNAEAGEVWLRRAMAAWPRHAWINPVPQDAWGYTRSIEMIRVIVEDAMYPMTPEGIGRAADALR